MDLILDGVVDQDYDVLLFMCFFHITDNLFAILVGAA